MASHKTYHQSRCIRIAFLVKEHNNADVMLDAIFSDCHSRWGGRFNLVIPCENSAPIGRYDTWLKAYDPDVIYSYIDLSAEEVSRYHESYGPSYLVKHEPHGNEINDERHYRPKLPLDPLTSLSTIGVLCRPTAFEGVRQKKIVEVYTGLERDRFIEDSFGTFYRAFKRSPFPRTLRTLAVPLTVAPQEAVNPRFGFGPDDLTVPTATELLKEMSKGSTLTFSQFSSCGVRRIEFSERKWATGLSLVIGDGFIDRISHWDSRSLFPVWRDNIITNIYIPKSRLDDDEFISTLAEYFKNNNHVTNNNQPSVVVRSHSENNDTLQSFCEKMRENDKWSTYTIQRIESLESCVPDDNDFRRPNFINTGGGIGSGIAQWNEAPHENHGIRISAQEPAHLEYYPVQSAGRATGSWAVDFKIERTTNLSGIVNVTHQWVLPRRLRMTEAFVQPYEMRAFGGGFAYPRSTLSGDLSAYMSTESPALSINIPSDKDAFYHALVSGRSWRPFAHDDRNQKIEQSCTYLAPSTQGRAFEGVIGLFGDLDDAQEILLSALWNKIFDSVGATSRHTDQRKSEIELRINKRLKADTLNLKDENQKEVLINIILTEARAQRITRPSFPWSKLQKIYEGFHKGFYKTHHPKLFDGTVTGESDFTYEREIADNIDQFQTLIQVLCSKNVLFQGRYIKCKKCFHENWVSIRELDVENFCEVCKHPEPAPISLDWDFMINTFLLTALRERAVQSLFWALSRLREIRATSFYYLGPTDIWLDEYPENTRGPDGDIDLLVVSDGIVRACEVKQSGRDLDLRNFIKIIKRLRPDIATLAVMENETPKTLAAFEQFKRDLVGTNIDAELVTLRDGDFDEHPIFGLQSYRLF